jgi:transcriptional regulator GlxA family with amidase domain
MVMRRTWRVHDAQGSAESTIDDDQRWRRPDGPAVSTIVRTRTIAMIALNGIVIDEALTFRSVLGRWPGVSWVTVGRRPGRVSGVGGEVVVDAGFDEVDRCDVLVVPGAIGSEATGADEAIGGWIASRARSADWVLASSTGTLALASAGVELGDEAAGHWLAGERLASYGIGTCTQAYHQHDRVITASGWLGARRASLRLTEELLGRDLADEIAAALAPHRSDTPGRARRWWPPARRR